MKKLIILFVCCLVASVIKVILVGSGSMGALPTLILFGGAYAIASLLSKDEDK